MTDETPLPDPASIPAPVIEQPGLDDRAAYPLTWHVQHHGTIPMGTCEDEECRRYARELAG